MSSLHIKLLLFVSLFNLIQQTLTKGTLYQAAYRVEPGFYIRLKH